MISFSTSTRQRRAAAIFLFFATAWGALPPKANAADDPKAHLSPTQQQLLTAVATQEFCGCKSALTLNGCLQKRPACQLAQQLQGLLVKGIDLGAPQSALETFMSQQVLGPFCAPSVKVRSEGMPSVGKGKNLTTVVEFFDFRCTHCRHTVPSVHKALQTFAGKIQVFYAPISLVGNEQSTAAAEAAMAAHAQGKFAEMHTALFAREAGDFDLPVLQGIAKKVGLDMKQFDRDMSSHKFRDVIASFKKAADAAGVTGTPAFFIDGRPFSPAADVFELSDRLQMERVRDEPACN